MEEVSQKKVLFLKAFVTWTIDKDALPETTKMKMISCFNLKQFSRSELLKMVRKTAVFKDEDIFEVLEEKMNKMEENLSLQTMQVKMQGQQISKLLQEIKLYQKQSQFIRYHWNKEISLDYKSVLMHKYLNSSSSRDGLTAMIKRPNV